MRIGIYARGLSEKTGGSKEYIKLACQNIGSALGPNDEVLVIHNCRDRIFNSDSRIKEIKLPNTSKLSCDFLLAPRLINRLKLDSVWFPKNVIPFGLKPGIRKIVSILDLAHFYPELKAYDWRSTWYMKHMIRSSCQRADRIIAISENTRQDLIRIINVPRDKIEVIPLAASVNYQRAISATELVRVREKYQLPNQYILFAGGISPRKNLIRLIKAFRNLNLPERDPVHLVLTGGKGWRNKEILEIMKTTPRVHHLGYVPDQNMPVLYRLATVFAYPSLYEGFGMPILEAQTSGIPVLSSRSSCLPEVGADSVYYIDMYDCADITKGLHELIVNQTLRDRLTRLGYRNIQRYNWRATADQILNLLK